MPPRPQNRTLLKQYASKGLPEGKGLRVSLGDNTWIGFKLASHGKVWKLYVGSTSIVFSSEDVTSVELVSAP
jgi:hypothetical protein